MSDLKLSICIATLNRAALIGVTLDSIISQATDDVEIVVVDGASTDNTKEVIRLYQQRFPRLRYYRLDAKGGVDQDYCKAVELAQGEYCWLFSDDDILKPGAIQAVLRETRRNYGLIIVNAEVRNADLSGILKKTRLQIEADHVYHPADRVRLFIDIADYLSYIGCIVIKRKVWNMREKERYFGTVFVHVGVIFQSPLPEDTLVIVEPLISIRYGNALWTPKSFEISLFKWPELIWSFADYPESVKQQVCVRNPWQRLWTLLVYRARGAFSIREYQTWIEPQLVSSWWFKFAAQIIARLSGFGLNAIISFYAYVRQRSLLLVDLQSSPFYYRRLWWFYRPLSINQSKN